MRIKVEKKKFEQVLSKDKKQLLMLNCREHGMMYWHLINEVKPHSIIYMIKEKHKILAWACIIDKIYNFYTRKSHRHKGLATKLAEFIMVDTNKKYLSYWEGISDSKRSKRFNKLVNNISNW